MAGSRNETQALPDLSRANVAPPLKTAGAPTRVRVVRAVIAVVLTLGLALLWMVWRAAVLSPRRLDVAPLDTVPVDAEGVAHALARTIRHQTISRSREAPPAGVSPRVAPSHHVNPREAAALPSWP